MAKKKELTTSILVLSFFLMLSGVSPATENTGFTIPDPVAVVNGKPISKIAFELYAQQLRGKAKIDSPESSNALVEQLVLEELLVQEANKQKLADDPQVKQQFEMIQRSLLASTVIRRMLSESAPSEEAIKKEYDNAVAAMKSKEYKAAHILVDSEDKAKAIIKDLKRGGNFAELAKTRSSDSSAAEGGDLGWFTPSMMVPSFAQATAKLEKGKYTEQPVQTEFGWHVILLEDIRDATPPSMDEMKPQIAEMLQSKIVNDYLEKLKSGAKIEVTEIQVSAKSAERQEEAERQARQEEAERQARLAREKQEKENALTQASRWWLKGELSKAQVDFNKGVEYNTQLLKMPLYHLKKPTFLNIENTRRLVTDQEVFLVNDSTGKILYPYPDVAVDPANLTEGKRIEINGECPQTGKFCLLTLRVTADLDLEHALLWENKLPPQSTQIQVQPSLSKVYTFTAEIPLEMASKPFNMILVSRKGRSFKYELQLQGTQLQAMERTNEL